MSNQNDKIVLDLSWNRKQELRWLESYPVDKRLMCECAYYPKPPAFGMKVSGCVKCSFEKPSKSCPYAHLLTFSRPNQKVKMSNVLRRELEKMSEEDREAVEQFMREREREREEVSEMYTSINFKTKKELKEAVAQGRSVTIFQPGGIFNPPEASPSYTGRATVEGPHYPKPHTWYAQVEVKEGKVIKVK